ncbi:hypothetical protein E2C01_082302 [Portunus trituberculatus]|uniref:Uncharacterized protein n=1 Tax=Portunus trituberculatus TaxID=210409 RepID=A0A5B7IRZ8_PORTR|nr:hypothetical protein [Portunus trituberculatus]
MSDNTVNIIKSCANERVRRHGYRNSVTSFAALSTNAEHVLRIPASLSGSPVDDAFAMQELESRGNLGAVETRPELIKAAAVLDVEHEVATRQVLHHEEEVTLWKKKKRVAFDHYQGKVENKLFCGWKRSNNL